MAGECLIEFTFNGPADSKERLDVIVAARHPELSRSTVSRLIREGSIRVDNKVCKPGYKPLPGERINGVIPAVTGAPQHPAAIAAAAILPDDIPIHILFEDAHCLALNKPPGLVIHPAPGHRRKTLANALIHHRPEIRGAGSSPDRPGIVHRLDKDTSGLLLVAKTHAAFNALSAQFKERQMEKKYLGLVYGRPPAGEGRIDLPIGRHVKNRKKMSATRYATARPAETFWRVRHFLGQMTLMEYTITTGRTHQIRVHSAAIHCPIAGDTVYGIKKPKRFLQQAPELKPVAASIERQMLHAWQIRFTHPTTGMPVFIEAPMPEDMAFVIEKLEMISE